MELFGRNLVKVADNGENSCEKCAISDFCNQINEMSEHYPQWNYPVICASVNKIGSYHFEEIE